MAETTRKPEIRFAGFTDDWEQRKLGELAPLRGGYAFKSTNYVKDGIPIVRISNILSDGTVGGEYSFYSEMPDDEAFTLKQGSIVLAMSGATTGKVAILGDNIHGKLYQNQRVGYFTKTSNIDYSFVGTIVETNEFHRQLDDVLLAGAQPNVSAKDIDGFIFYIPQQKQEQEYIGTLIHKLDNLIALHQRNYSQFLCIKQSMLEKMFPKNGSKIPEIRFDGFTDSWEQRKLSRIASMHARIGWQNLRTSEFLDKGDYYLITGTDFINGVIDLSTCHFISKDRYDQDKNIQVYNGSILITKDGTLGKVAYVKDLDKPATLNAGVFNVKIMADDVDNQYLYQYLKAPFLMDYVEQRATGGTIKHLNQNILVDFPVILPTLEEQKKIGEFFMNLDDLIALHQCKLNQLQNIKKFCLEKMFVS